MHQKQAKLTTRRKNIFFLLNCKHYDSCRSFIYHSLPSKQIWMKSVGSRMFHMSVSAIELERMRVQGDCPLSPYSPCYYLHISTNSQLYHTFPIWLYFLRTAFKFNRLHTKFVQNMHLKTAANAVWTSPGSPKSTRNNMVCPYLGHAHINHRSFLAVLPNLRFMA